MLGARTRASLTDGSIDPQLFMEFFAERSCGSCSWSQHADPFNLPCLKLLPRLPIVKRGAYLGGDSSLKASPRVELM